MTPLVSIIIPAFNSEKFIAETLKSVESQSYKNWECIIINDLSEDNTSLIVRDFLEQDDRFRYLYRNRLPDGASTCRNIGIEYASGEYTLFLDSDDLLHPDCLLQRVQYMISHPRLDFAVFQMETFGSQKLKLTKLQKNYLDAFLRFDFSWQTTCPFWKTDFILKLQGFNENVKTFEDPEFHIRAMMNGAEYVVLPTRHPDSYYRLSDPPNVKGSLYYQLLSNYSGYLTTTPFISKLDRTRRPLMQHGIARLIKSFITPIDSQEIALLNRTALLTKNLGIISPGKYKLLKKQSELLFKISCQRLQQIMIWSMASQFIHPETIYKNYIRNF